MYVCMYACMHGCMDAWMHGCMDAWMHACMHACMYVCIYTYIVSLYIYIIVCAHHLRPMKSEHADDLMVFYLFFVNLRAPIVTVWDHPILRHGDGT